MNKIYIIAGENSGDFIGSKIMNKLNLINPQIQYRGVGGKLMLEQGLTNSLFSIDEINIMGFVEILPKILRINKLIKQCIKDIIDFKPDLLITIDSPGFTFRVARSLKLYPYFKTTLLHIVAPSVWAYKPKRAKKYASIYDHLFVLLPFEPQYFEPLGLKCTYIGHPFLEQNFYQKTKLFSKDNLNICVTCGSRKNEILKMSNIFIESLNILTKTYSNISVTFVIINMDHQELILPYLKNALFNYNFSTDKLRIFAESDIALAKSGTNTLEISASRTPLIIGYKINMFSYLIIKSLIRIKYISLINIIANKMIIPELVQNNFTPTKIVIELLKIIRTPKIRNSQLSKTSKVLNILGLNNKNSPSSQAALTIQNILTNKLK